MLFQQRSHLFKQSHRLEGFFIGSFGSNKQLGITGLVSADSTRFVIVLLINRDHTSSTKAEVVLKGDLSIGHLSFLGHTSQLPDQFRALSQAGGTERMPLGNQTTRWVHHILASICVVTSIDEFACFTLSAKSETFVSNQLVGSEAIVQFNNLDVIGGNSCLGIALISSSFCHICSNNIHTRLALEGRLSISSQTHSDDFNSLIFKTVSFHEIFRTYDGSTCTVRSRATLQLGQGIVNLLGFKDFLQGMSSSELRVRVVQRMSMILLGDLSNLFLGSAIPFHMFATSSTEKLRGEGGVGNTSQII
mmetsp:Transcript_14488/g.16003  ORF Transcript_14488/g.16003 Transcript_14488/m.16003 type:complete len:305 (-) Transcript_14488:482-1396(-)